MKLIYLRHRRRVINVCLDCVVMRWRHDLAWKQLPLHLSARLSTCCRYQTADCGGPSGVRRTPMADRTVRDHNPSLTSSSLSSLFYGNYLLNISYLFCFFFLLLILCDLCKLLLCRWYASTSDFLYSNFARRLEPCFVVPTTRKFSIKPYFIRKTFYRYLYFSTVMRFCLPTFCSLSILLL